MAKITSKYPYGDDDKTIQELISGYSKEIYESRANINTLIGAVPLLQLGLSELQAREIKRTTRWTVCIAILSLFVAFSALVVSYTSIRSSNRWEKSQLELLKPPLQVQIVSPDTPDPDGTTGPIP